MSSDFVPFGLTEEEERTRQVLVPGVPNWIRASVLAWLRDVMSASTWADLDKVRKAESHCMLSFGFDASQSIARQGDLVAILGRLDDTLLLRLVDFWLWDGVYDESRALRMRRILDSGHSKWKVEKVDGRHRLTERVPSGVQEAAEAVMASGSSAGALLRQAWQKVHALEPDDSGAFAYAVRAVEAASFPALGITDAEATLGNSIRTVERGAWGLPFKREHALAPSKDVLVGMLRTLWRGHRDRHGSADYSDVDHAEAVAAVTLAVTLVGWFESGAVQERPTEEGETAE